MKDAHWKIIGIVGILLLVLAATTEQKTEIVIGKVPLQAMIADTEEERMQGLSSRESLQENEGMLFLFEEPGNYGFWMKDMNFSIDIIWIDQEKRVAGTVENVGPETFPQVFYPPSPVQYVLETNAGWAARNNIGPEDQLDMGR